MGQDPRRGEDPRAGQDPRRGSDDPRRGRRPGRDPRAGQDPRGEDPRAGQDPRGGEAPDRESGPGAALGGLAATGAGAAAAGLFGAEPHEQRAEPDEQAAGERFEQGRAPGERFEQGRPAGERFDEARPEGERFEQGRPPPRERRGSDLPRRPAGPPPSERLRPPAEPQAPDAGALWEANTPAEQDERRPPVQQGRAAREDDARRDPERVRPRRSEERSGESPIFEETSAWFRDNWLPGPEDQGPGREEPRRTEPPRRDELPIRDDRRDEPVRRDAERRFGSDPLDEPLNPAASRPSWTGGEPPPRRTDRPAAAAAPPPAPEEPRSDEWAGSEPGLQPMPETVTAEVTAAGLPKRRPRAQLIPGGPPSGSDGDSDEGRTAAPARSAEQVRGRLASYQSGVRQGRENRLRRMAETANAGRADANGKENA
jgi:hypothetical protein